MQFAFFSLSEIPEQFAVEFERTAMLEIQLSFKLWLGRVEQMERSLLSKATFEMQEFERFKSLVILEQALMSAFAEATLSKQEFRKLKVESFGQIKIEGLEERVRLMQSSLFAEFWILGHTVLSSLDCANCR